MCTPLPHCCSAGLPTGVLMVMKRGCGPGGSMSKPVLGSERPQTCAAAGFTSLMLSNVSSNSTVPYGSSGFCFDSQSARALPLGNEVSSVTLRSATPPPIFMAAFSSALGLYLYQVYMKCDVKM